MYRTRSLLTLALLSSFSIAAQNTSPSGAYGFLMYSTISTASANATGLAILGVMNFDGAGSVSGPYTYEVDANRPDVPKTISGAFTGTYTINSDGTGTVAVALDAGFTLTFTIVVSDNAQTLHLVATDYQFPAAKCSCNVSRVVVTGVAKATPAASLNGSYGFELKNLPNVNASVGTAKFDGAGNVTVAVMFVGSSDANGQPTGVFPFVQTGTYSINPDGTGTMSLAAVPGVTNATNYSFVTTDGGSGAFLMQTDRAGSGVQFGSARLQ